MAASRRSRRRAAGAPGPAAARAVPAVAAGGDRLAEPRARRRAQWERDRRRGWRPLLLGAARLHHGAGAGLDGARRRDRPAGGLCLRPIPLPGTWPRARDADRALRAADARGRARLPAVRRPRRLAQRRARLVRARPRRGDGHDLGDPRGARLLQRSDRGASRLRRVGEPRSRDRGGRAAAGRGPARHAAQRDAAGARTGDRLGGGAGLRLHLHLLRGRARARRAGPRDARGRDLPPRRPAHRAAGGRGALARADRDDTRGAQRLRGGAAPHRAAPRAPPRARPAAARGDVGGARPRGCGRARTRAVGARTARGAGARCAHRWSLGRRDGRQLPAALRGHRAGLVHRTAASAPLEPDVRGRGGGDRRGRRHARSDRDRARGGRRPRLRTRC